MVDNADDESKGLADEPEDITGITSLDKCDEPSDFRHEDETPAVDKAFHVSEEVSDVTANANAKTPTGKPSKRISSLIDFFDKRSSQAPGSSTVHQNPEAMFTRHDTSRLSGEKHVNLSTHPKLPNISTFTKKEEEPPWHILMMVTTPSISMTPLFYKRSLFMDMARVGFMLRLLFSGSDHGPAK